MRRFFRVSSVWRPSVISRLVVWWWMSQLRPSGISASVHRVRCCSVGSTLISGCSFRVDHVHFRVPDLFFGQPSTRGGCYSENLKTKECLTSSALHILVKLSKQGAPQIGWFFRLLILVPKVEQAMVGHWRIFHFSLISSTTIFISHLKDPLLSHPTNPPNTRHFRRGHRLTRFD